MSVMFALLGLWVLLWRTQPWKRQSSLQSHSPSFPVVSVIVPCRNEEERLGPTLESLVSLDYPQLEVIVVDDDSSDGTLQVARSYPVRILEAPNKPPHWCGKNWACWVGAQSARGEYLLFTDADTLHSKESLKNALSFLQSRSADLISAPPYHLCQNFFEKVFGLFLIIPLVATAYRQSVRADRLYAIGQYLLFRKEKYFSWGGHQAISNSLVDDLDLAKSCLKNGGAYHVYPWADLYSVQMFENWSQFHQGWTRLLRLGMKQSSWPSFLETVLIVHLFTALCFQFSWELLVISLAAVVILAWVQSQHSKVPALTSVLAPLSVFLLTVLSLRAALAGLFAQKIIWRGRAYPAK